MQCSCYISYLSQASDGHDLRLPPLHEPLWQQVEYGKENREVQREMPRHIDRHKRFMQRLLKIRAVQMVIRFCKRIFGDNIRRKCHPRPAKPHNGSLIARILIQPLAEPVNLGADGRLEVGNLRRGEEGADGLAAVAVEVVVYGGEGVAGVAEAAGEVGVLVSPACAAGIEVVEVDRVVDVELSRRDADNGAYTGAALEKLCSFLGNLRVLPYFLCSSWMWKVNSPSLITS